MQGFCVHGDRWGGPSAKLSVMGIRATHDFLASPELKISRDQSHLIVCKDKTELIPPEELEFFFGGGEEKSLTFPFNVCLSTRDGNNDSSKNNLAVWLPIKRDIPLLTQYKS